MYRIVKVEDKDKTRYYAEYKKWYLWEWVRLSAFSRDTEVRSLMDIEDHKENKRIRVTYKKIK